MQEQAIIYRIMQEQAETDRNMQHITVDCLLFHDTVKAKEGRTGKVVPLSKWLLYVLPPHAPGVAGLLASLDAKGRRTEGMLEVVKKPKRTEQIKAYVTPEEFTLIMESSDRAGLSMSEFARRVCLGFRVESREDQQARRELLKVNADLGRLGGLLKQALATGHKEQIYGLLHKIDQLQASLKAKIRAL